MDVADVEVDSATDGGAVSSDQCPSSSTGVVEEDPPNSFAALGTTSYVPSTSTPSMNNDIFFDLYQPGEILSAFSSISELLPVSLLSISQIYNTILDSSLHTISSRISHYFRHTTHPKLSL